MAATSRFVLAPDGSLRASPEEIFRTPSDIAIMVFIFILLILMIFGIAAYWHELENAKKLHPDSAGYGKWYFSPTARVVISIIAGAAVVGVLILGIVVIFVVPGPMLAQAYARQKYQEQSGTTLKQLEGDDVRLANYRVQQILASEGAPPQ